MKERDFIIGVLKQSKKVIIVTSAISIILGCIELVSPLLSKKLIDDGLIKGNLNIIMKISLLLCGIQLINGIIKYWLQIYQTKIKTKYQVKLNNQVFAHAIRLDAVEFEKEGLYKILNNAEYDINKICELFGNDFLGMIQEFFKLIACFIVMFYISWQLTLILLVTVPIKLFFNRFINKRLKAQFKKILEVIKNNTKWLSGIIDGIYEIKLLNLYSKVETVFYRNTKNRAGAEIELNKITQGNLFFMLYIDQVSSYFVYYIGTIWMLAGKISIGGILVFSSYIYFFFQPIEWYTRIKNSLAGIVPSVGNYIELMEKPEENMIEITPIDNQKTEIEFENVYLEIGKKNILKNISLKFETGDKIAITGSNGSGKTSLIKLLLKLYNPSAGKILFNGTDIEKVSVISYREQFAVMNQNVFLFNETIKDNITLFESMDLQLDASQKELLGFIEKLPEGMEKVAGLNGNNLSGGEKQRVAMVRTLKKGGKVLIIDEGTSNCDKETTVVVNKILQNSNYDITIVITHDLNRSHFVNRVIKMEDGTIVGDIRKDVSHDRL
ncbi:ABC transporter ATP-binding protein [Anaeromicropila populeti]|uniref:ATP-binding cassette, subfamily B n=1 Tax=Anaeromicropila populeti TaxID=37658 RepID=A0A1I6IDB4_9FIRM|nr:ABC transporter ATP-binding protein [Anaeromicropila populeti]SFR64698.1 ATP-binding cassette, subfamily B [Anaeromicropila populeti]